MKMGLLAIRKIKIENYFNTISDKKIKKFSMNFRGLHCKNFALFKSNMAHTVTVERGITVLYVVSAF